MGTGLGSRRQQAHAIAPQIKTVRSAALAGRIRLVGSMAGHRLPEEQTLEHGIVRQARHPRMVVMRQDTARHRQQHGAPKRHALHTNHQMRPCLHCACKDKAIHRKARPRLAGNLFANSPAPPPVPAAKRRYPPANRSNRPARSDNRPARGSNRPAHGSNRPTRGSNRPTRGSNRPTRGSNRPTRGSNRPTRGRPRKPTAPPAPATAPLTRGAEPRRPERHKKAGADRYDRRPQHYALWTFSIIWAAPLGVPAAGQKESGTCCRFLPTGSAGYDTSTHQSPVVNSFSSSSCLCPPRFGERVIFICYYTGAKLRFSSGPTKSVPECRPDNGRILRNLRSFFARSGRFFSYVCNKSAGRRARPFRTAGTRRPAGSND